MAELLVKLSLLQQIQEAQLRNEKLLIVMGRTQEGKETDYELKGDECLYYKGRISVPEDEELKKNILKEAHNSFHAMHEEVPRPKNTLLVAWNEERDW